MPKIRKNYGAVRAESIRTDARTDGRTHESKSIVPPKFLGRSKNCDRKGSASLKNIVFPRYPLQYLLSFHLTYPLTFSSNYMSMVQYCRERNQNFWNLCWPLVTLMCIKFPVHAVLSSNDLFTFEFFINYLFYNYRNDGDSIFQILKASPWEINYVT